MKSCPKEWRHSEAQKNKMKKPRIGLEISADGSLIVCITRQYRQTNPFLTTTTFDATDGLLLRHHRRANRYILPDSPLLPCLPANPLPCPWRVDSKSSIASLYPSCAIPAYHGARSARGVRESNESGSRDECGRGRVGSFATRRCPPPCDGPLRRGLASRRGPKHGRASWGDDSELSTRRCRSTRG